MTITSLNIIDGSVGRRRVSNKRKTYIAVAVILLILLTIVLLYIFGVFKNSEELIPPNPQKELPPSPSKLKRFRKAAVCADGPPCAEIGKNILKEGGNAMDAAIAAMVCNGIYTMQSMGLGGGFLMTFYKRSESKAYTINAREKAPLASKPEKYKSDEMLSKHGPLSIGVPGEIMGYIRAHEEFGKLNFSQLIEPSIDLCEKGYLMSKHQEFSLTKNDISNDTNLKSWFMVNGKLKKAGDRIVPKKLCETLKILRDSPYDFYNGSQAKTLAEDIHNIGGIITEADFNNYTVEIGDPISITLKDGIKLYSVPPPGSGVLLGFILNILNNYDFKPEDIQDEKSTILTYHRIIEAFKYAYARRTELGDPDLVDMTSLESNLTSTEYAKEIWKRIRDNSTSQDPEYYGGVTINKTSHGTAHISVISEEGDAVSVTSSVNIYFGSGYTSKRTGILLNSVMDDFSFPYFKNYFGLPGSPNNELKPGKRPVSSMSPSILVDEHGDVKLVIGASGGSKITSSVAEVIMRVLWFDQNLKEAVDAPRIYHQLYPMLVEYDYGVLKNIIEGLEKLGHKTERIKMASSIVCALLKNGGNGTIFANADYRKGGEVYGI